MTNPIPSPRPLSVSSSSSSLELGPAKAVASGIVGIAIGFLTALITANADGAVTTNEWLTVALATVVAAAAAFGVTYATPTRVTLK